MELAWCSGRSRLFRLSAGQMLLSTHGVVPFRNTYKLSTVSGQSPWHRVTICMRCCGCIRGRGASQGISLSARRCCGDRLVFLLYCFVIVSVMASEAIGAEDGILGASVSLVGAEGGDVGGSDDIQRLRVQKILLNQQRKLLSKQLRNEQRKRQRR